MSLCGEIENTEREINQKIMELESLKSRLKSLKMVSRETSEPQLQFDEPPVQQERYHEFVLRKMKEERAN
jgi:hypothetical protein